MQETQVQSLGWKDPLEKGMATHSSILAWRILQKRSLAAIDMGSQRFRHDLATNTLLLFTVRSFSDLTESASWYLSPVFRNSYPFFLSNIISFHSPFFFPRYPISCVLHILSLFHKHPMILIFSHDFFFLHLRFALSIYLTLRWQSLFTFPNMNHMFY